MRGARTGSGETRCLKIPERRSTVNQGRTRTSSVLPETASEVAVRAPSAGSTPLETLLDQLRPDRAFYDFQRRGPVIHSLASPPQARPKLIAWGPFRPP